MRSSSRSSRSSGVSPEDHLRQTVASRSSSRTVAVWLAPAARTASGTHCAAQRDASNGSSSAMNERRALGGTLVLGGGFAGGYVARLLGKRGATIVSPENFMLYTPMLPEAASGTLEPRHVVVPLRMMCPHAELLLGRLTGLGEERRTATVRTGDGEFEVGYEQAVLALGSVARVLPIPGLAEHGLGFKD